MHTQQPISYTVTIAVINDDILDTPSGLEDPIIVGD